MAMSLGPRAHAAGTRLQAFDQIGSTNAEALMRAREGESGPIWFVTTEQTAGRGRRSRAWIAPRGNLASSILEIMDIAPSQAATLGFAAGLALVRALEAVSGPTKPDYRLKWPNDVLADGKKLAGILLEAETVMHGRLAVVVGIGTNVIAAPEGTATPATSLAALGVEVRAEELFAALSDAWHECRGIWDNGRGFVDIRTLWLARAAGLGEAVSVVTGKGNLTGTFETLDDTGCLIVRTADAKRVAVAAGDIYFGSAASAGASA
jgi:BirA family biotin operon repressor/biotin-[acetyl-CoA-carboxylase] ligase